MFAATSKWIERRRTIRRRSQAGARALVAADEVNAYYEAQRRAARARIGDNRAAFYHWVKVAAEVGRVAPRAEMDIAIVRTVAAEVERNAA